MAQLEMIRKIEKKSSGKGNQIQRLELENWFQRSYVLNQKGKVFLRDLYNEYIENTFQLQTHLPLSSKRKFSTVLREYLQPQVDAAQVSFQDQGKVRILGISRKN